MRCRSNRARPFAASFLLRLRTVSASDWEIEHVLNIVSQASRLGGRTRSCRGRGPSSSFPNPGDLHYLQFNLRNSLKMKNMPCQLHRLRDTAVLQQSESYSGSDAGHHLSTSLSTGTIPVAVHVQAGSEIGHLWLSTSLSSIQAFQTF